MGRAGTARKSDAGIATGEVDGPLLPVGACEVLLLVIDLRRVLAPARSVDATDSARAGLIKEFTGIDDPYETPVDPELVLDTDDTTPDESAHKILLKLESMGLLSARTS